MKKWIKRILAALLILVLMHFIKQDENILIIIEIDY